MSEHELGPLPERTHFPGWTDIPYYTADQMRAYALAEVRRAVEMERERWKGMMHAAIAQAVEVASHGANPRLTVSDNGWHLDWGKPKQPASPSSPPSQAAANRA